ELLLGVAEFLGQATGLAGGEGLGGDHHLEQPRRLGLSGGELGPLGLAVLDLLRRGQAAPDDRPLQVQLVERRQALGVLGAGAGLGPGRRAAGGGRRLGRRAARGGGVLVLGGGGRFVLGRRVVVGGGGHDGPSPLVQGAEAIRIGD